MKETTPRNQRIYLRFEDAGMGMMRVAASITPPAYKEPVLVLLSRGVMPLGQPVSLLLVSDPTQNPALRGADGDDGAPGADGASAYQLAREQGYGGTLTQWLASLVGAAGKSAYQLARDNGYGGTLTQWLASLIGAPGKDATTLLGEIAVSEKMTVAVNAGLRRLTLTTPASWGVVPGQDLLIHASALPSAAYALHDVVVVEANKISVGITTPALALLSSYSITARVRRLN